MKTLYEDNIYNFQLNNGLTVNLISKPGSSSFFAGMLVNFGAKDLLFTDENKNQISIPAGTAHFLEHKMFEKEEGDIFADFSNLGADANAWTNYNQTNYHFSSSRYDNFNQLIRLLMRLVYEPYFTKELVEKEQGIIGQEISMYLDDPYSRSFNGVLAMAYPEQPLSFDVAGTKGSIAQIDEQLLYSIHKYFYQSKNMVLTVVGDFDAETLKQELEILSAEFNFAQSSSDFHSISQFNIHISPQVHKQLKMNVSRPIVNMVFKSDTSFGSWEEAQKFNVASDLISDILFDDSSSWHQEQVDAGIIDDEFFIQNDISPEYSFLMVSAKTEFNDKDFRNLIVDRFKDVDLITRKEFEREQMSQVGSSIRHLDNINQLQVTDGALFERSLVEHDLVKILQTLDFEDAISIFKKNLKLDKVSLFTIKPL